MCHVGQTGIFHDTWTDKRHHFCSWINYRTNVGSYIGPTVFSKPWELLWSGSIGKACRCTATARGWCSSLAHVAGMFAHVFLSFSYSKISWFPKVGVPLNHTLIDGTGFSSINHPFGGTPIYGNLHLTRQHPCISPCSFHLTGDAPAASTTGADGQDPKASWTTLV